MSWTHYDDIGDVFVISALHDDVLKKDDNFINYAIILADRIIEDQEIKAKVSWGKWGVSLEPKENPHLGRKQIEDVARAIVSHPAWIALIESTRVFTYGKQDLEI